MSSTNFKQLHKIAQKLGYKKDQQGIYARYLREKTNWTSHLDNTKSTLVKLVKQQNAKRLCILGSGWLLDCPTEQLLTICEKLTLVDIHHPEIIRKKYTHSKIEFITTDITGMASQLYNQTKGFKLKHSLNLNTLNFNFNFIQTLPESDLYISLNVLDQLDTLICEYLQRKNINDKKTHQLIRENIQVNHIKQLSQKKYGIMYDLKELHYKQGKLHKEIKTCFVDKLLHPLTTWNWDFDNNGYYLPNATVKYSVGFFNNL